MDQSPAWLERALRVVIIAGWVALFLGVLGAATSDDIPRVLTIAASLLGAAYVLTTAFIPTRITLSGGLVLEILVVTGAMVTVAAATLTGGAASSFLLLAVTPTLLAAVAGGTRMGLTTGFLSAGLITLVTVSGAGVEGLVSNVGAIALFPLLALLVAQIRNLLVESEMRAETLERASIEAEAEVSRLADANDLLRRLTDVYADGASNPVEVSRAALGAIVDAYPGSFATATMFDAQGPVVVARVGTHSPDLVHQQIPIGDKETTSGVASIGTMESLSSEERADIDRLLRPVAISFANSMLLQDIAGAAVDEERIRLARELHDEIGPALASLGLSLDLVALHTVSPEATEGVASVRENLASIVEDLRAIIADLRAESSGSLTDSLRSVIGRLQPPPEIVLEVEERRPPRAAAARQIAAVIIESVRNAHRHADATSITVGGIVDRSSVDVEVIDDGVGFSEDSIPEGHYGVMGMRERAARIGAHIDITSGSGGTTIQLTWKDTR